MVVLFLVSSMATISFGILMLTLSISPNVIALYALIIALNTFITLLAIQRVDVVYYVSAIFLFVMTVTRALFVVFQYESASVSYTFRLYSGYLPFERLLTTYSRVFFVYSVFLPLSFLGFKLISLLNLSIIRERRREALRLTTRMGISCFLFWVFLIVQIAYSAFSGKLQLRFLNDLSVLESSLLFILLSGILATPGKRYSSAFFASFVYVIGSLKRETILPVLLFFYFLFRERRKRKYLYDTFVIIFILIVVVLAGITKNLYSVSPEAVYRALQRGFFVNVLDEFSNGDVFPILLNYYSEFPVYSPLEILEDLPSWFLPRSLFPSKPISSSLMVTSKLFPAFGADIPYGILGGGILFLGFGLGFVCFAFLCGVLLGFISQFLKLTRTSVKNKKVYYLISGVMITSAIDFIRVGTDKVLFSFVVRLITSIVIIWLYGNVEVAGKEGGSKGETSYVGGKYVNVE